MESKTSTQQPLLKSNPIEPPPQTSFNPLLLPKALGSIHDISPCPYDPTHSHKSGRHSLDYIYPCGLRQPAELQDSILNCPFNASHLIHKDNMIKHLEQDCVEFKEWIYVQTLNGQPLSLDPRDLITKCPQEEEVEETGGAAEQLSKLKIGEQDEQQAEEENTKNIPKFLLDFIKSKKLKT